MQDSEVNEMEQTDHFPAATENGADASKVRMINHRTCHQS
jgi:hypothetical protein